MKQRRLHLVTPDGPPRGAGVVLLLTRDDELRTAVATCAARAGAHLVVADLTEPADDAELVLVGADLATTLQPADLADPDTGPHAVIVHGRIGPQLWTEVARVHAAYVVTLPDAGGWLTGQLRPIAHRIARRLRGAGYPVSHADRDTARAHGYVWCADLHEDNPNGLRAPYVSLERVARGDCQAKQSDTTMRSNFRALHRDYPDTFTDLEYANATALGAFLTDLPPHLVELLHDLAGDRPIYEEDDFDALENEDITASWQHLQADVTEQLGRRARAACTALNPDEQEAVWWRTVHAIEYRPDHSGFDVVWDLPKVVPAYAAALVSAARRPRRPRTARSGTRRKDTQ